MKREKENDRQCLLMFYIYTTYMLHASVLQVPDTSKRLLHAVRSDPAKAPVGHIPAFYLDGSTCIFVLSSELSLRTHWISSLTRFFLVKVSPLMDLKREMIDRRASLDTLLVAAFDSSIRGPRSMSRGSTMPELAFRTERTAP